MRSVSAETLVNEGALGFIVFQVTQWFVVSETFPKGQWRVRRAKRYTLNRLLWAKSRTSM